MLARLNIHKKNQFESFQRIVFKNLFEVWKYMAKKYAVAFNRSLQEISFLTPQSPFRILECFVFRIINPVLCKSAYDVVH